jgi:hypothetical protein
MKKVSTFVAGLCGCLLLVTAKFANGQADAPKPDTVVHAYDIRDFLLVIKDYPLKGNPVPLTRLGETPPAAPTPPPPPQQQAGQPPQPVVAEPTPKETALANRADEVKKLIIDAVATSSWKDNGGDMGSISVFNGQLIVTQTPENQKAIQSFLDDLRRSRAGMVRIRADWLLLTPEQVEKLQKGGADDKSAVPEIGRDLVKALPQDTVHYSGSIACFSGQTVHIASGRAKSVVTNLTPTVGPDAVAMTPTVSYLQEGVSLEATATVIGDTATLDLASIVSGPNKEVRPATTQPVLDRVDSELQHFHTTVQVPLNKPVLVAGATANPTPQEPAGKQLYLVIEADSGK